MSDQPNTLRRSAAPDAATILNNYAGRYPTEDWTARYWDVTPSGELQRRQVTVQLPRGFTAACLPISLGLAGCVRVVRRWGFGCYPEILNDIDFDVGRLVSDPDDDEEWLARYFSVVTFDLPAYFVIASPDHPFLLVDPDGTLKGSYSQWRTQLGALSYLVSGLDASFVGLQIENNALYRQALDYLSQAVTSGEPLDSPARSAPDAD